MVTKGELCALAAAAIAISGISASGTEEALAQPPLLSDQCAPPISFADLWVQVVAKAWDDRAFKERLLENPAKALEAYFHYKLPPNIQLEIVEGEPGGRAAYKLTLPPKPQEGFLPDARTLQFLQRFMFPC